ncbi:MAG: amino acid aminotransferase [Pseudomonadota bacterium]
MLTDLKPQAADKILALAQAFKNDPRARKIDLGIGVYKNSKGVTPVMRAVETAQKRLSETETTKSYTAVVGDPAYHDAMIGLILGDIIPRGRVAAAATPGGTGAIRQALELIRMAAPEATVWLSMPSWPNHSSIIKYLGMPMAEYRYFDSATCTVDFAGMMADLARVKRGDVVLLQGCCHNPTGANPKPTEWGAVIERLNETGAVPLIDIAYQGLGDGLEEDAAATRSVAASMPECLIAASCSKNFGIYRERAGILMAVAPDTASRDTAQGILAFLHRQNFSFPPDHGTRLVTMVLSDPTLKADWMAELEGIRTELLTLRRQLAHELQRLSGSDRFGFLAAHRGMFSRLGASPELVEKLRADHGIYMLGDSRMNIAGLNAQTVPVVARAIIEAGL